MKAIVLLVCFVSISLSAEALSPPSKAGATHPLGDTVAIRAEGTSLDNFKSTVEKHGWSVEEDIDGLKEKIERLKTGQKRYREFRDFASTEGFVWDNTGRHRNFKNKERNITIPVPFHPGEAFKQGLLQGLINDMQLMLTIAVRKDGHEHVLQISYNDPVLNKDQQEYIYQVMGIPIQKSSETSPEVKEKKDKQKKKEKKAEEEAELTEPKQENLSIETAHEQKQWSLVIEQSRKYFLNEEQRQMVSVAYFHLAEEMSIESEEDEKKQFQYYQRSVDFGHGSGQELKAKIRNKYNSQGVILFKKGDYKEALPFFQRAIQFTNKEKTIDD